MKYDEKEKGSQRFSKGRDAWRRRSKSAFAGRRRPYPSSAAAHIEYNLRGNHSYSHLYRRSPLLASIGVPKPRALQRQQRGCDVSERPATRERESEKRIFARNRKEGRGFFIETVPGLSCPRGATHRACPSTQPHDPSARQQTAAGRGGAATRRHRHSCSSLERACRGAHGLDRRRHASYLYKSASPPPPRSPCLLSTGLRSTPLTPVRTRQGLGVPFLPSRRCPASGDLADEINTLG